MHHQDGWPRRIRFSIPFLLLQLVALPLPAQGVPPGRVVATTLGWSGTVPVPAANGVFVVDPLALTSTPLAIAGYPATAVECPWGVQVESPVSLLLTTVVFQGFQLVAGDLYRATWNGTGFAATSLLPAPMAEAVVDCEPVGNSIWFTTSSLFNSGVPAASKLWRVARGGGPPALVADFTALGHAGAGGGLAALGSTLHVFTFVSDALSYAPGEHLAIDTTANPPTLQHIADLPPAGRLGQTGQHFGSLDAVWDPRLGAFAVTGVYGEVLWQDPVGNNVARRVLGGIATQWSDYLATGITYDTDTGTVLWGDKEGHLEQVRTAQARMQSDLLAVAGSGPGNHRLVMGLGYVGGSGRYLPTGPIGCPRVTSWMTNTCNSRPLAGNTAFTVQLDDIVGGAWLLLGSNNLLWNGSPLPLDLPAAPGCQLGTSVDLGTVFVARGLQGIAQPLPLPAAAFGAVLYTQWAVLQANVNPLGVALSEVRRLEVR